MYIYACVFMYNVPFIYYTYRKVFSPLTRGNFNSRAHRDETSTSIPEEVLVTEGFHVFNNKMKLHIHHLKYASLLINFC